MLFICGKILKYANYEIVAYSTSTIVILFTVLAGLFGFARHDLGTDFLAIIANTIGLIAGLFITNQSIGESQRAQRSSPATTAELIR